MKVLGLLVVLPILIGFTDAAVTGWTDQTTQKDTVNAAYSISSDENIADTVALVTLTASVSGTGTVTYSISSETNTGQFEITSGGEVSLASGQTLDREADASITVAIQAIDSEGGDSGVCTLTLTVNDLNDNTPTFTAPATSPHSVEIADGSTASTALYTVTATDADATGNTITYSIHSGDTNNDYTIDGSSGAITVASGKTLAKSTTASYELVIYATDNGSPAGSGSATLSVTVCDPCGNGAGNHNAGLLSFIITLLMCVKKFM